MAKGINGKTLDEVYAALNKKYPKDQIQPASKTPNLLRLPSGSHSLDFALGGDGLKGYPLGRITRNWGGELSGKTLGAYNTIRNAQNYVMLATQILEEAIDLTQNKSEKDRFKRHIAQVENMYPDGGMKVVYFNAEQQFDEEFAKKVGINTDDLDVSEGTVIEEIGEKLENIIEYIDMFVIDSCSSAISLSELNMEVEEQRRGTGAKQWGLMLRRAMKRAKPNNIGIIIDQARIDMKTGAEYAPGGKYLDHVSSLTMHYRQGTWLYRDKNGELVDDKEKRVRQTITGDIEPDGMEIQVRNDKSRVGKPFKKARMRVDFDNNARFDLNYEIISAGIHLGLIEKAGSWYSVMDENGAAKYKAQGTSQLAGKLEAEDKQKILQHWRAEN